MKNRIVDHLKKIWSVYVFLLCCVLMVVSIGYIGAVSQRETKEAIYLYERGAPLNNAQKLIIRHHLEMGRYIHTDPRLIIITDPPATIVESKDAETIVVAGKTYKLIK